MGIGDKIQNKAEELGGKAKAAVGDLTDNEQMEAEGRAQEFSGKAKQAGERVKDKAEDVADDPPRPRWGPPRAADPVGRAPPGGARLVASRRGHGPGGGTRCKTEADPQP